MKNKIETLRKLQYKISIFSKVVRAHAVLLFIMIRCCKQCMTFKNSTKIKFAKFYVYKHSQDPNC